MLNTDLLVNEQFFVFRVVVVHTIYGMPCEINKRCVARRIFYPRKNVQMYHECVPCIGSVSQIFGKRFAFCCAEFLLVRGLFYRFSHGPLLLKHMNTGNRMWISNYVHISQRGVIIHPCAVLLCPVFVFVS